MAAKKSKENKKNSVTSPKKVTPKPKASEPKETKKTGTSIPRENPRIKESNKSQKVDNPEKNEPIEQKVIPVEPPKKVETSVPKEILETKETLPKKDAKKVETKKAVAGEETTLLLIPTYNEKDNLVKLIQAIHQQAPAIHILVIDDNSPDGTGQIADSLSQKDDRIHVLHRAGKLGLGTAYIEGFQYGLKNGYQWLQQMDCDFSHRPEDLPKLFQAVQNSDFAIGSRYVSGGGIENWPWYRFAISKGGSFYARTILGVDIQDLTGGFKCWKREVLEAIDLSQVQSSGYSFQIEMTWRALQKGFRCQEVPITFVERREGQSKMNSDIVHEAVWMCWKLRLGWV